VHQVRQVLSFVYWWLVDQLALSGLGRGRLAPLALFLLALPVG